MANQISVESIEARLAEIEKERVLLLQLIALQKGQPAKEAKSVSFSSPGPKSNTIRGRVVDATIELVHRNGQQVTNEEVLQFVNEKRIDLGKNVDKARAIGAILSQECEKKSAKLKRISRGVYDEK
jgi:hypothetical protein